MEWKLEIVKHLLKYCLKHIFIILAASKRTKHTVLKIITPRILIPEKGQSNAPLVVNPEDKCTEAGKGHTLSLPN